MTGPLLDVVRWLGSDGLAPLLMNAALRMSALFAVAWLAMPLLKRTSAATRHLVWAIAFTSCLLMPVALSVVPTWKVAVLPAVPHTTRAATLQAETLDDESPQSTAPVLPNQIAAVTTSDTLPASRPQASEPPAPSVSATILSVTRLVMPRSLSALLLATWAGISALLLVRLAAGLRRVARTPMHDAGTERWAHDARDLAEAMGITRPIRVVQGGPDTMPMTWGVRRPVVMLPEGASAWPESQRHTVLVHELAHIRRHDCLTQTMAGVACALYWFNPLVWFAASRLVAERERACDDTVLDYGADGGEYAEQLLEVARSRRPDGVLSWAAVTMARRTQLEGRLLAILDPNLPRRHPSRRLAVALTTVFAIGVPVLGGVTAVERPSDTSSMTAHDSTAPAPAGVAPDARAPRVPAHPPERPESPRYLTSDPLTTATSYDGSSQATPMPQPTPMPMPAPTPSVSIKGNGPAIAALAIGTVASLALADMARDAEKAALKSTSAGGKRPPVEQKVLDALIEALKDADAEIRAQAAFTLGQMRDTRTVDALKIAIDDVDVEVRESVIFALSQIRDSRAIPALIKALEDASADIREQAAFALAQQRDPAAVPGLRKLLSDKSADVREQAVFALGQLRDPRAVDALIGALRDSSADVRAQAAWALGQTGDARATDALTAALKDNDRDVRKNAAFALAQVVGREK